MGELETGQVKIIASNNGDDIDEIEMLLLPKAKIKLTYDKKNHMVNMNVSDPNILNENLDGALNSSTLYDLTQALSRMRKRLDKESK